MAREVKTVCLKTNRRAASFAPPTKPTVAEVFAAIDPKAVAEAGLTDRLIADLRELLNDAWRAEQLRSS